jgi:hypothetical protein
MIGMSVRNQNKIDTVERSDFIFASFENRIRQPGINEQDFSARRYDLESRLAVPSELRVHDLHETEKHWFSKRDKRAWNDEGRMTNHEGMTKLEIGEWLLAASCLGLVIRH